MKRNPFWCKKRAESALIYAPFPSMLVTLLQVAQKEKRMNGCKFSDIVLIL